MANPLRERAQNGSEAWGEARPSTREQWIDWCWTRNLQAQEKGWRCWHYVTEIEGRICVKSLSADDTSEVWAMMEDKPLVPYGWTTSAVRQFVGLVMSRLQRGMSPDAYLAFMSEGRVQRRKNFINSELGKNPNRD